jgi:WD40 repeat protein
VLANSGRMLFAGTDVGTVRAYKFPLTGEYSEVQVHSAPVTRMRISPDDAFLFSAAEDASLFVFDVREKDARGVTRDKEVISYAEEILVTKSDLEEKTQCALPAVAVTSSTHGSHSPNPSPSQVSHHALIKVLSSHHNELASCLVPHLLARIRRRPFP